MARPTLEELTDSLDEATVSILGDPILYTPAGGSETAVNAFVGHGEERVSYGVSSAVVQGVTVELFKTDAPVKPNAACRVRLPKITGQTFQPVNVRLNEAGTGWLFELKTVAA